LQLRQAEGPLAAVGPRSFRNRLGAEGLSRFACSLRQSVSATPTKAFTLLGCRGGARPNQQGLAPLHGVTAHAVGGLSPEVPSVHSSTLPGLLLHFLHIHPASIAKLPITSHCIPLSRFSSFTTSPGRVAPRQHHHPSPSVGCLPPVASSRPVTIDRQTHLPDESTNIPAISAPQRPQRYETTTSHFTHPSHNRPTTTAEPVLPSPSSLQGPLSSPLAISAAQRTSAWPSFWSSSVHHPNPPITASRYIARTSSQCPRPWNPSAPSWPLRYVVLLSLPH